jgi:hypothetical protein
VATSRPARAGRGLLFADFESLGPHEIPLATSPWGRRSVVVHLRASRSRGRQWDEPVTQWQGERSMVPDPTIASW